MRHDQQRANDDLLDGRDEAWYRFLNDVDDLLSTGQFGWAEPVLRGMQDTVERHGRVTPTQRRALANIAAGLWPGRRR
jgi:hypothetical protein